ncbi:glycosyltransferase [Ilumatobacter sp.]|uniref:glycosyltransferase n=1 Tax=Ilumatobacter sp. TaxID=1967498 RepID=UPI003B52269F
MRVVGACSLGGAGHLEPLRPVLDAAGRLRAETIVAGPPALAELVADAGFDFAPCGEPHEDVVAPIRERLATAPAAEASVLGDRELFGRLATTAMLPGMERLLAERPPDLVVRDPCEYASAVVAHRAGIGVVQVAIGLAEVEWRSIGVAAPALEDHRAGLADEVRATPYVSRLPASVDPSPFGDTRRFRSTPVPASPLPDWWDGSTAPLVYVSFGTVLGYMTTAAAAYEAALEAVAGLEARVLMTVGHRFDPDRLGPVASHVHVERWVDQTDVLAEADLVVCHGGSGTTFGALAAGLPVVITPMFADQHANGAAVEAAGAGLTVTPGDRDGVRGTFDRADVGPLIAAIAAVRDDGSHRVAAQRIAEEMAAAPTLDELVADLLSDPSPRH